MRRPVAERCGGPAGTRVEDAIGGDALHLEVGVFVAVEHGAPQAVLAVEEVHVGGADAGGADVIGPVAVPAAEAPDQERVRRVGPDAVDVLDLAAVGPRIARDAAVAETAEVQAEEALAVRLIPLESQELVRGSARDRSVPSQLQTLFSRLR